MQNRKIAESVAEILFDVADRLEASVDMIEVCAQEGKVRKEEAQTFRTSVLGSLDKLYKAIIGPIYEKHPDSRPPCSCCGEPAESEEDPQP